MEKTEHLEKAFKALAHRKRLAILKELLEKEEANVLDISRSLSLPFSTASRNLIILERAGFLKHKEEGNSCRYSVAFPNPNNLNNLLLILLRIIFKEKSYLISYSDSLLLHPRLKQLLKPFIEPKPK